MDRTKNRNLLAITLLWIALGTGAGALIETGGWAAGIAYSLLVALAHAVCVKTRRLPEGCVAVPHDVLHDVTQLPVNDRAHKIGIEKLDELYLESEYDWK